MEINTAGCWNTEEEEEAVLTPPFIGPVSLSHPSIYRKLTNEHYTYQPGYGIYIEPNVEK